MTRKRLRYALAVVALLFVGAGCTDGQNAAVDTGLQADVDAKTEANVKGPNDSMKADAPDTVDASIDAMLKDSDSVMDSAKEIEKDANDISADGAAANAYGSASYDAETK